MMKIFRRTVKEQSLHEIDTIEVGCWIHLVNPSLQELEMIAKKNNLGMENLKNTIDEGEVPRIDKEKDSLFVFVRVPLKKEMEANTTPVTIIITPSYIITITLQDNRVIESFLNQEIEFYTTQKAKFLLNAFNTTILRFERHINAINKRVVTKKGNLKHLRNDDIVSLVETEEDLNDFVSSLAQNINVFEKVVSEKYLKLYETDQEIIEDVLVDAKQVLDLCKTNINRINNIREAYSTILTNNLNKTMKFLAAITVIFTIPTTVSSIYGMNVSLPYSDNPFMFFYLMFFIGLLSFSLLGFFFWRRWL